MPRNVFLRLTNKQVLGVSTGFPNECVSRGKKCPFFEKFGVLCFLVTPVLRFALLPTKSSFENMLYITT